MSVESQAPEAAAPEAAAQRNGVSLWFAALFRALWIILLTLAILAVLGFTADVVLHRITRTSHSSATYTHIYEIDVVVDGDGSVAITGTPSTTHQVTLTETDNSTMFAHPQRAVSVIGGTLFVSVRCPDAFCSADLGLAAPPDASLKIRIGNAFHLNRANVIVKGLTGPVDLSAWPANVTVTGSSSMVTGAVAGSLNCAVPAVCIVQVPPK
jgi:hypothetical protein